jgi:type IV secretion system protein VirB4
MATAAFSSFLRYLWLDDHDVIRLEPDGYLASFRIRGRDPVGANPNEFDDYERSIASLLERKGMEWGYHITVQRGSNVTHPEDGSWQSSMNYGLDWVRAQRYKSDGEHLPSDHRIWFSYYPLQRRGKLLAELTGNADYARKDHRNRFRETLDQLERSMRPHVFELERLGSRPITVNGKTIFVSDLVSALYQEITGDERLFAVDDEELFLSGILAPDEARIDKLELDGKKIFVATIWGFPSGLAACANLAAFSRLPFKVRFTTRIIPFTTSEAEVEITKRSRNFLLASLGPGLIFNQKGEEQDASPQYFRETLKVARERNLQNASYSHTVITLVGYCNSDEEYRQLAAAVRAMEESAKVKVAIELGRQRFMAYLGSLPGELDRNHPSRALMTTAAACKSSPLGCTWHGPKTHPNKRYPNNNPILMLTTREGEPFRFYHHVGEVGHTLMFGQTGQGKSVMLRAMENGHLARYPGASAICLDIGYSAYKFARAIRGQHLTAQLSAGPQFAWLAGLDDPEQYPLILDDTVTLYEIWQNSMADIDDHRAIETGLKNMLNLDPARRHLSDLARVVPKESLRSFFERFKGSFLDAAIDNLNFANAAVRYWAIEYGTLGVDNVRWVSPFVSFVQRRAFAAFAQQPTSPRIITIDEGARSLRAHRMRDFAERIDREGRKHLTSLIIATQSASEVINSPIKDVLKEQTKTLIVARTPAARDPKTRDQYREVGFTEEQVSLIPDLEPFEMLIATELGHQIVRLLPTDLELAVYADASEEDHQRVDAAIAKAGARWFGPYCESRKDLPDMSEYVQALETLDQLAPTPLHSEAKSA